MIVPLYRYTVICVRRYNGHKMESAAAAVEAPDSAAAVARALDKIGELAAPRQGASPWWPAWSVPGTAIDAAPSLAGHLGTLYRDPLGKQP